MDTIWLNPKAGGPDSETVAHEMRHVFESYRRLPLLDRLERALRRKLQRPRPLPGAVGTLDTGYWGFEMTLEDHAHICPLVVQMARRYKKRPPAAPRSSSPKLSPGPRALKIQVSAPRVPPPPAGRQIKRL
jgi:hypothetical protein